MGKKRVSKGFVEVVGHAIKLKNFRRETNGLVPFFDKLRITKEQENELARLLDGGQLVEVVIRETQKTIADCEGLFSQQAVEETV